MKDTYNWFYLQKTTLNSKYKACKFNSWRGSRDEFTYK